jgi:hypothetical protein
MNIKKADSIINQISATVSNWYAFAEEAKVNTKFKESIAKAHIIL